MTSTHEPAHPNTDRPALAPSPAAVPQVRETEVPRTLEVLAALTPVDYREAYTFSTTDPRSAEQWARLALEHAPLTDRAAMITVWTLLGIRLAPPWSRSQVLGWRLLHNTPDAVLLEARAAAGVTARLILHTTGTDVTQAMLIRYDRPLGRLIWSRMAPRHHAFMRTLMTRASMSAIRP